MIANCDMLIAQSSSAIFTALVLGKEVFSYLDQSLLKELLPVQNSGSSSVRIAEVCRQVIFSAQPSFKWDRSMSRRLQRKWDRKGCIQIFDGGVSQIKYEKELPHAEPRRKPISYCFEQNTGSRYVDGSLILTAQVSNLFGLIFCRRFFRVFRVVRDPVFALDLFFTRNSLVKLKNNSTTKYTKYTKLFFSFHAFFFLFKKSDSQK
jgi:hypothetical protein